MGTILSLYIPLAIIDKFRVDSSDTTTEPELNLRENMYVGETPVEFTFRYPEGYEVIKNVSSLNIKNSECTNSNIEKSGSKDSFCPELYIRIEEIDSLSIDNKLLISPFSVNQCNSIAPEYFKEVELYGKKILRGSVIDNCPNSPFTFAGYVEKFQYQGKYYAMYILHLGENDLTQTVLESVRVILD